MIAARKSARFTRWFAWNAQTRIFRTFAAVRVHGLEQARAQGQTAPLLFVANHSSWWDPLAILYVTTRLLALDGYALMDAKNLRRLPFFGLVGAFGVDLDDPSDGAKSVRYAARLLSGPGRAVWIFPQGREVPVTARPLAFHAGTAQVARVASKAMVVPVAIRYEHGSRPEPTLLVSFGEPLPHFREVTASVAAQVDAVTCELARIDRALVVGDDASFETVYERRASWRSAFAEASLSWLTRGTKR
jgi:1-acyl-sn-glycerol-3-phosphate acyltransferase